MTAKIDHISDTALWVAMFRALESDRHDALFQDPYARLLAGERGEQIVRRMPARNLMKWVMAIRTVAIDRLILSAIAQGVDTVINMGAGLDRRPYRMVLPESVHWVEVDFPDLTAMKNERLKEYTPVCRLTRKALDLGDRRLREKFLSEVSEFARSIVVITEGVIMYLEKQVVRELAQDLLATPKIDYWIQDYRHGGYEGALGPKMRKALKDSPFVFAVGNWFDFFNEQGWVVDENLLTWQEAKRVGRRFPYLGFVRLSHFFMSKEKRQSLRDASGYVRLKRAGQVSPQGAVLQEGIDYTLENGNYVFSSSYLRGRGYCCDSGCRNCPY